MNRYGLIAPVAVNFKTDIRGNLGIAELGGQNHFEVKRIYYITDVPEGQSRGAHGHKELEQIFFCLKGSFTLTVSDGQAHDSVSVDALNQGFYVPSGLWRDVTQFSEGAVCLVLASRYYEESDYIYSFEEFKKWREGQ